MNNSKEYYNKIAKEYHSQSNKRLSYLDTIDNLIIERMKGYFNINYLDIGTGDGRRALKISKSLNQLKTTLLDDSNGMLALIDDKKIINYEISIFDFDSIEKYDLITCLWNVLGHFPSKHYRLLFFNKIENLLSETGLLIFDVNNRYNIVHYGFENVMKNIICDRNNFEDNGWFSIGNDNSTTKVYIHNPFDIEEYLKGTSLKLVDTIFVDYETGRIKETFFEGQLLYIIGRNNE